MVCTRGYDLKNVYEAVYHCPEHGEFMRPTTHTGHAADKIKCPKCKEPIPLVRTQPFRDSSHFPGLETK